MRASWVAKVGGSLLEPPDFPELPRRLGEILRERGGERPVLIVGGGPGVDAIRRWDRLFSLGEEFCHWTAVRLLTLNSHVLARILPATAVATSATECAGAWEAGLVPILDPFSFLRDVDGTREDALPRRWRVTSDSIAARVAVHFGAPELALLKSTPAPAPGELSRLSDCGYVDAHFETTVAGIPSVVAVDLRSRPPAVSRLR